MSAKFDSADFRRIQWSLLTMVLLAAAGAGAVAVSLQTTKAAKAEQQQVKAERSDIQGKLSRARDEEQEIRAKIARYQELQQRGYIGQEQRLDWVEQIARIKAARKLIDVQYELAPQKPVEAALLPEGAAGGGHEFMSSAMKLQMRLLHEGDLLGFLDDLRGSVRALLVVRGCNVERLARTGGGERGGTNAQLKAECDIDWITLREKK